MKLLKKILLLLLVVFLVIQFIRPERNTNSTLLSADISKTVYVPGNVSVILKNSCYDCHANYTRYPWYMNIQPIGWLMADHIKEGKSDLNFSEFGNYSKRKQTNKLRNIETTIMEGEMPISSYTALHRNAKLNEAEKKLISEWVSAAKDSIALKN